MKLNGISLVTLLALPSTTGAFTTKAPSSCVIYTTNKSNKVQVRLAKSQLEENKNPLSDFTNKLPFFQNNNDGKENNNADEEKKDDESNDEIKVDASSDDNNVVAKNPQELLADLGIKLAYPEVLKIDPEKRLDIAGASMPFVLRLGSGSFCEGYEVGFTDIDSSKYVPYNVKIGDKYQLYEKSKYSDSSRLSNRQPRGPIVIYEFEACPFCRKVREAVSILSLEVEFRPTPQGSVYRDEIKKKYGRKATFPFMVDPNTGIEMFESDDIIAYLFRAYGLGEGDVPKSLTPGLPTTLMTGLSLLFRFGKGSKVKASKPPAKPLILWSAEGTPFGKLVREELTELQIAHKQISCPRGGVNRQRMFEQAGRFQIPYLEDPNTGVKLFESSTIVEYLQKMYGLTPTAVEYL